MAKKKKKLGWRDKIIIAFLCALGIVFSSTAVVLVLGMLPTVAAYIWDRSKEKLTALTVGAMNLAGCFPFILEVWFDGPNDMYAAFGKFEEIRTWIVIYMAAAIGWLIDWAMTGIIATIMYQKGQARMEEIKKIQKKLIERWGPEVTGTIPLDEYGYPIDQEAVEAMTQVHKESEAIS